MSGVNVVLLTGLAPTVGHQFLLNFALNYANQSIDVIVSTRSFEPTSFDDRVAGLVRRGPDQDFLRFYEHADDDAPQRPSGPDDTAFWDYWRDVVVERVGRNVERVFASEDYGVQLAERLKAEYVPVDHSRLTTPTQGSTVRENLWSQQMQLASGFRHVARSKIVFFGADSTGKTTLSSRLAEESCGCYVPEWARLYLDKTGLAPTPDSMYNIVLGQNAIEQSVNGRPELLRVFDTDLLTTLGFYRYFDFRTPKFLRDCVKRYKDRFYILMNDKPPFVPDPQRYGGDRRETTQQYWKNLLEEFGCKYYEVQSSNLEEQFKEIWGAVHELLPFGTKGSYQEIINFKRD